MRFLLVPLCLAFVASYVQAWCDHPGFVQKGSVNCSGSTYPIKEDESCQLQCEPGHNLKGVKKVVCRRGKWSGSLGKCEPVMCPALKNVRIWRVKPESCLTKASPYSTVCHFSCPKGYVGSAGSYCSEDGQWEHLGWNRCMDNESPVIESCPKDMVIPTDPGKPTAEVSLPKPSYTDNSLDYDPDAKVIFQSNVPLKSDMNIGRHYIKYFVVDKANYNAVCRFTVDVQDKERPKFQFCPKDINIVTDGDATPRVNWDEPRVKDNSGDVRVFSSRVPGAQFPVGSSKVVYTAKDPSGNKAECVFNIHIKWVCKDYSLPHERLKCSIPASNPKKCDERPFANFVEWKKICRKTCRAC